MLGSGMYNLSSGLAAPFSDDMVRIWFVPSRTVAEYGARYAIAMRFPSGDHVGIPGAFSVSCSFVTLPLATSTTDTCAARQIPFTSKNAIRFPSGDHDAPCGWVQAWSVRAPCRCAYRGPTIEDGLCLCQTTTPTGCRPATTLGPCPDTGPW